MSEKVLCVKKDRHITEDREKQRLEKIEGAVCLVGRVYTGFRHVKLKGDRFSYRSQLGERIRKFKIFGLLRDCYIYGGTN